MPAAGLARQIVHVASGREWRGGQNQVYLLTRELARARDPVRQVVVTGAGTMLARKLADAGVPVRGVGWRAGLSVTALAGAVRECAGGPSLLHAHDAHALTIAGVAGLLTGTPFVVTRRVVFPLGRRGFWPRAERIIAVSQAVRDALLADGLPPQKIPVVHSGIDLEAVRSANPAGIRARLGLPEDAPLVVSLGALDRDKDPEALLAAAAALAGRSPELYWAIAGDGPLRSRLEAAIARENLGTRVALVGRLDHEDALRLIASARVYVTATRAEGLGTTVLEAMALGVPIVATRVGGIPEMLGDGAGVLIPPGDPAELAAAVEELLMNSELRARSVGRAADRVEHFTARAMAEGVLAVYRTMT